MRHLVLATLSLTSFVALGAFACSDSSSSNNNGTGGAAGAMATGGTGGGATGGSGGGMATGGSGGGMATGGAGGGGTGGSAGAGTGGSAGAGTGGSAGMPAGDRCRERCTMTSDCLPGFECISNRCEFPGPGCMSDNECVIRSSFASSGCTNDGDCTVSGDRCVVFMAANHCATPSSGSCFFSTEQSLPLADTTGNIDVCVNDTAKCPVPGGLCLVAACESNTDCAAPFSECDTTTGLCGCSDSPDSCGTGEACNASTGQCECTDDSACTAGTNVSVCNTTTGLCECANNADCTFNSDVCNNGTCGCSNATVCAGTTTHPSTTFVCEAN